MNAIYLQQTTLNDNDRTWCEDKINADDEKYIHIDAIRKKFKNIVNGKSIEIPKRIIKNILEEIENL